MPNPSLFVDILGSSCDVQLFSNFNLSLSIMSWSGCVNIFPTSSPLPILIYLRNSMLNPHQFQEIGEPSRNDCEFQSHTLALLQFNFHFHGVIQLLQKTGQIERTVDREFADEEAKYRTCVHLQSASSQ